MISCLLGQDRMRTPDATLPAGNPVSWRRCLAWVAQAGERSCGWAAGSSKRACLWQSLSWLRPCDRLQALP